MNKMGQYKFTTRLMRSPKDFTSLRQMEGRYTPSIDSDIKSTSFLEFVAQTTHTCVSVAAPPLTLPFQLNRRYPPSLCQICYLIISLFDFPLKECHLDGDSAFGLVMGVSRLAMRVLVYSSK